jgi:hypothetical protein
LQKWLEKLQQQAQEKLQQALKLPEQRPQRLPKNPAAVEYRTFNKVVNKDRAPAKA